MPSGRGCPAPDTGAVQRAGHGQVTDSPPTPPDPAPELDLTQPERAHGQPTRVRGARCPRVPGTGGTALPPSQPAPAPHAAPRCHLLCVLYRSPACEQGCPGGGGAQLDPGQVLTSSSPLRPRAHSWRSSAHSPSFAPAAPYGRVTFFCAPATPAPLSRFLSPRAPQSPAEPGAALDLPASARARQVSCRRSWSAARQHPPPSVSSAGVRLSRLVTLVTLAPTARDLA